MATQGEQTSEFRVTQTAQLWGIIALILGLVIAVGSEVAAQMGADSRAGVIAGAAVAIAGLIQKTLVSAGYIRSRTEVKSSQALYGSPPPPPADRD